jgi:hypothetical protein
MRTLKASTPVAGIIIAFIAVLSVLAIACLRDMQHVVAAYHVMDVPPSKVAWFTFFFWAILSIPACWVAGFALALIEFRRKRRNAVLAMYIGLPFAAALAYWLAWEIFVASMP